MTIQELFRSIDNKAFLEHYFKNDGETLNVLFSDKYTIEEKIKEVQNFKEIVSKSFEKMKNLELKRDEKYICFAVPYLEDENMGWDSFISKREDILNKKEYIEKYAYELSPVEETLCYDVSKTCIRAYGDIAVAVAIFNELTFCGINFETREDEQTKIHNNIEEAINEIKEAKENGDESKFVSIDNVFKELNWTDERKDFEKEYDKQKMLANGEYFKKSYNLIMNQEYLYLKNNN